jgi:hypothetical protein
LQQRRNLNLLAGTLATTKPLDPEEGEKKQEEEEG